MSALLLSFIWGWEEAFPGSRIVVFILYFGLGALRHARLREMPSDLGLGVRDWRPALRNITILVVPVSAVVLAIGAALGSLHFPSWERSLLGLAWVAIWGIAQQYGLLCFFYRGFVEILKSPGFATAASAVIFAVFHAPNPFLMVVTLGAGVIACVLYRLSPNVILIGVAHGAISYVLYYALPESITHGLRVGPGYYSTLH